MARRHTRLYTERFKTTKPWHGTEELEHNKTFTLLYISIYMQQHLGVLVFLAVHLCECIFVAGVCLSVHFRMEAIAPARLDRSWHIRVYCIS